MIKNIDVTVVGSLNYDIILKQDRLPQIGETVQVDSIVTSAGGKGANQAVQCAKLGLQTYMLGAVGQDVFGQALIDSLNKFKVQHQAIQFSNQPTGMGIINSFPNGELLSNIATGANFDISLDYIKENEVIIARSEMIVLQLEIPVPVVEYVIELADKHNCTVLLNGAPSKALSSEALRKIDYFIVNEAEASFYANQTIKTVEEAYEAIEVIYALTHGVVVITLGSLGSLLFDGQEKVYFEPQKVNVVETTGAGDTFVGAMGYCIKHDYDNSEMGKFATKASSITIQKIGAQDAMPFLEDILE